MAVLVVGLTHRDAPVELRERLAIGRQEYPAAHGQLSRYVPEGVILSTCNRTEIYASVGHRSSGLRAITHYLSAFSGIEEAALEASLHSHWQQDAVRHLFRVSAGLDSMILGEGQILGQVREAYELASLQGPVGPVLSRLFDRALLVGKRARTETAIARSAVSVSQAAVEQAALTLGTLAGATVLLIGAGKMGQLAARVLQQRGAARIIAANRGQTRAAALVSAVGGEAWSLERLPEALTAADVVISSTASDDYIVTRSLLAASLPERRGRPLVAIDIAVPRDIEPDVADLPGVSLFNIDDLRGVCSANLDQRRRESSLVEAIVEQEVERFIRWCDERELAPTIRALVDRGERIRQDELARALQRLGQLSDKELNALNAMSKAIVQKMLHEPITRLKRRGAGLDGHHYALAARELFGLSEGNSSLDAALESALE